MSLWIVGGEVGKWLCHTKCGAQDEEGGHKKVRSRGAQTKALINNGLEFFKQCLLGRSWFSLLEGPGRRGRGEDMGAIMNCQLVHKTTPFVCLLTSCLDPKIFLYSLSEYVILNQFQKNYLIYVYFYFTVLKSNLLKSWIMIVYNYLFEFERFRTSYRERLFMGLMHLTE
jgi:hypothetical protein